jgi:hypothetical protein
MTIKIAELQCIMPIVNIPTVLEHGILSYERASKLAHSSVAMGDVQEKRDQVRVPGGLKLHQYANMYFHARNPMMYKRKEEASRLCILRISTEARHIAGAVLTDCNAASPWVRFLAIEQVGELDLEAVYASDWRHPGNEIAYKKHKAQKCAEFLVPHQLPLKYIDGAYVVNEIAARNLTNQGFNLPIEVDSDLFFH